MRGARLVVLPVVAVLLALLATQVPTSHEVARAPQDVTVTQTSYACPGDGDVATGSLTRHSGATQKASAVGGGSIAALSVAGRWATATPGAGAVVVSSNDPQGAGAVGFVHDVASKKQGGGTVVGACAGVTRDAWYVGAGSGQKHLSSIRLTNLTGTDAVVDLSLWGTKGPIDAVDAEGIVVPGGTSKVVPLASLAAGEPLLGVHLRVQRGALSASVLDTSTAVFAGTEQLPATLAPALRQVVSGLPAAGSGRTLRLLNPGTSSALVSVQAFGKDGAVTPAKLSRVRVGAGKVVSVDVPASAGSEAVSLRVTSDQPVAATVQSSPSAKDYLFSAATARLAGTAVVPLDVGGRLRKAHVLVTAPSSRATATVEAHAADGSVLGRTTVSVDARSTTDLDVDGTAALHADEAAYLTVVPHGLVVGSAAYGGTGRVASLPLRAAPATVSAPDVRAR